MWCSALETRVVDVQESIEEFIHTPTTSLKDEVAWNADAASTGEPAKIAEASKIGGSALSVRIRKITMI